MVDTNVVVDALRGGYALIRLISRMPRGSITMSAITLGELHVGLWHRRAFSQKAKLEGMVKRLGCLSVDSHVAARYGLVAAELTSRGAQIGVSDTWIAAHALEMDCIIVTNDLAFGVVQGLKSGKPESFPGRMAAS